MKLKEIDLKKIEESMHEGKFDNFANKDKDSKKMKD